MKKTIVLLISSVCISIFSTGCSMKYRIFEMGKESAFPKNVFTEELKSLTAQQFAAYPLLQYSCYLPLADFEKQWQLEDFYLSRQHGQNGRAKIFYTDSPTATGTGAMGIFFAKTDDYILTFNTIIQDWHEYNILLLAIFCNQNSQNIAIELIDRSGKTFTRKYQLKRKWNKLSVDLIAAKEKIDIEHIAKINFIFYQIGQTQLYIDDIIIANHLQLLMGQIGGKPGTMFLAKAGKRLRVGVNKRFELVFADGKIAAWYDLTTDTHRINNLVPPSGMGPYVYQITSDKRFIPLPADNTLLSVHTSILSLNPQHVRIISEIYFGSTISGRKAEQTITYDINTEGTIKLEVCTVSGSSQLGLAFNVDSQQGFDGIIGKIRNPAGPPDSGIEYCLFRRMGKQQGADILITFKPFRKITDSIKCRLITQTKSKNSKNSKISAILISAAETGGSCMKGMLKIWPIDIDNLSNAERYVRKFFTGGIDFSSTKRKTNKTKTSWNPGWPTKLEHKNPKKPL